MAGIHWFYIKVIAAKSIKYSEKHSSFGHGNLYNLHLLSNSSPAKMWLSTQNRIFSFTSIGTTLMVQVLPNGKSLDFDYFKSRQMRWYIYIQNSQMNLASGAGNPGWLRTRPKLVCCVTWWLRSDKQTNPLQSQPRFSKSCKT